MPRLREGSLCARRWATLLGAVMVAGEIQAVAPGFDDRPRHEPVQRPSWLDEGTGTVSLRERLAKARTEGRTGVIVYFDRRDCPYAQAHLERNWNDPALSAATRREFVVIALDLDGSRRVRDREGVERRPAELAARWGVQLTPTLVFLDTEGRERLRLSGYHPPGHHAAAVRYVAEAHYRSASFRDYLSPMLREEGVRAHSGPQEFTPGPYLLDRSRRPAGKPLVVFFERTACAHCVALRQGPLADPVLGRMLQRMERVHLDMESDATVLTPGGRRTSARDWARALGLFYAPSLVFFDHQGAEVLRLDSPASYHRLYDAFDFVLSGAFRTHASLATWQAERDAHPASGLRAAGFAGPAVWPGRAVHGW